MDSNASGMKWVVGAILVPLIAAVISAGIFLPGRLGGDDDDGGEGDPRPGPASVFLSSTSGPGGSEVRVSGEGFEPGEEIVLSFHTDEIGRTRANSEGKFSNVTVTIPTSYSQFAPQQFFVHATGAESIRSARTPFQLSG